MFITFTLIRVGFLGVRFEVGGGKINPYLKLVRVMLETSNLAGKYILICSFREQTFRTKCPLYFADAGISFQKISVFRPKQYLYSKQWCESCVKYFLVLCSVFVRQKVTINENLSFTDYVSGNRLRDCSKLAVNWKNDNDVTIF